MNELLSGLLLSEEMVNRVTECIIHNQLVYLILMVDMRMEDLLIIPHVSCV